MKRDNNSEILGLSEVAWHYSSSSKCLAFSSAPKSLRCSLACCSLSLHCDCSFFFRYKPVLSSIVALFKSPSAAATQQHLWQYFPWPPFSMVSLMLCTVIACFPPLPPLSATMLAKKTADGHKFLLVQVPHSFYQLCWPIFAFVFITCRNNDQRVKLICCD